MGKDVGFQVGIPQSKVTAKKWKTLLYGLSGAGKTRTASIWPKPFYLDIEDGLGSVDRKVAWARIDTWAKWLGWISALEQKRLPVETLVLDSVNALQRLSMENSVTTFTHVKRSHGNIPGMSDYGKMYWDVWRSLTILLDLPYHIVLIAQATYGDYGELHKPSFVGQAISEPLLQAMDLVGLVEKTAPLESVLVFDSGTAVTKDRFGLFAGERFINPTWEDLTERGEEEEDFTVEEGIPSQKKSKKK